MNYHKKPTAQKTAISLSIILLVFIQISCLEKMMLPSEINVPPDFSVGDTTYLLINPIWDQSYGLNSPVEISIAADGHIFIADSASKQIVVLEQDGTRPEGFSALTNLKDKDGNDLKPIDVDVDEKMNIFYIDGSRNVYRWNQLWNDFGIDSIATSAIFTKASVEKTATAGSTEWFEMANNPEWKLKEISWTVNEELTDSLLKPHLFFDAGAPYNEEFDLYYNSSLSLFSGLSTSNDDNFIYVTDIYHDRIVQIYFLRSQLIKLGSGDEVWAHLGIFLQTITGYGTGAGTVNIPVAIDIDFSGNIYYAQFGKAFSIHKIEPNTSGDYVTYLSAFQQGENDIMDLERFSNPYDVTVDLKQAIYIANTKAREVQVFNSDGSFFKKAGVDEIIVDIINATITDSISTDSVITIDTTIWVTDDIIDIPIDTSFWNIIKLDTVALDTTVEQAIFLKSPRAIAVDDQGIIYVCDTPNSRIVRYKLSNTLDEDFTP